MSRVLGAVCRLCRREQTKLFLKGDKCYTKCILEKRPTPPGMAKPARGKPSAYAVRLREKQKLRRFVGMAERPFKRLVEKASRTREATGEHLLRQLELRLDNVVRRMGMATSLRTARQLVSHGHVRVNGKPVNIPSYATDTGDVVALSSKLKENVHVKLSLDTAKKLNNRPNYIEFDEAALSAKILRLPDRSEISFPVTEQLITEYYAK